MHHLLLMTALLLLRTSDTSVVVQVVQIVNSMPGVSASAFVRHIYMLHKQQQVLNKMFLLNYSVLVLPTGYNKLYEDIDRHLR
jgi:hypothetical protein